MTLHYEYYSKEQKCKLDWELPLGTVTAVREGTQLQRPKCACRQSWDEDSRLNDMRI